MHPNQIAIHPEKSTADSAVRSRYGNARRPSLSKFKQGTAAVALIMSLGLVMPTSFGGPAAADISNTNPQLMTIECDLNGDSVNDYESEVTSIDHDPGGKKLGKMQDTRSNLGFVPMEGYVISIFTAIENNEVWPDIDDSSPLAARPLEPTDSRLAGGYPASFETPPGYDFSYFGEGFKRGAKVKKNLVNCVVTDVGLLTGEEAAEEGVEAGCLRDGVLQDECFENIWVADYPEALTDSAPCLAFGDPEYDQCMAPDVTYLYQDDFIIKAQLTGNSGGKAQAIDKDKKHKGKAHKKGGHKGKKRGH